MSHIITLEQLKKTLADKISSGAQVVAPTLRGELAFFQKIDVFNDRNIDVVFLRIGDDAPNHSFNVFVDWQDATENGKMLSVVNTKSIFGRL